MRFKKTKYYPFGKSFAITHFPYVFHKKELTEFDKNHEMIHGAQQAEMLILGYYILFYLIYFILWIKNGYRKNPFEIEAHENEHNPKYLKNRKPFNWIRYV